MTNEKERVRVNDLINRLCADMTESGKEAVAQARIAHTMPEHEGTAEVTYDELRAHVADLYAEELMDRVSGEYGIVDADDEDLLFSMFFNAVAGAPFTDDRTPNAPTKKTRITIPGSAPNAVELSMVIEILVRCGYRVCRTTDYLEIYPPPEHGRPAVVPTSAVTNEEPVCRALADTGYFSDTWYHRNGLIGTNCTYHEVMTIPMSLAKLVYEALVKDDWTPKGGWSHSKGGDQVGAWWEFSERMYYDVDLPDWIAVQPTCFGWKRKE